MLNHKTAEDKNVFKFKSKHLEAKNKQFLNKFKLKMLLNARDVLSFSCKTFLIWIREARKIKIQCNVKSIVTVLFFRADKSWRN